MGQFAKKITKHDNTKRGSETVACGAGRIRSLKRYVDGDGRGLWFIGGIRVRGVADSFGRLRLLRRGIRLQRLRRGVDRLIVLVIGRVEIMLHRDLRRLPHPIRRDVGRVGRKQLVRPTAAHIVK